mgnify:CR=1 FL=1|tara:strand:+ start:130 stop:603 length:474 start_codon:yes stop_codon:yes gene_type:complete
MTDSIETKLADIANQAQSAVVASQINELKDQSKIASRIEEKRVAYEAQNYADTTFEKTIDGKFLKIWLPASVFVQQQILALGSKVMSSDFANFDEQNALTERFYKAVFSHLQVDGKTVNPETCSLGDLQAYAWLYWVELLAPLSLWGDGKAKRAILS